MRSWSINLFRIRGIQIAVHLSFFLLLAYYANLGYEQNGFTGMAWSSAMLVAMFTCVVLHELGHSFVGRRFGLQVRRILLMPIGGMAQFDSIPRQPRQELLMTIAGPAVNFAIAGLLWLVVDNYPDSGDLLGPAASLGDLGRFLLGWNLYMGLFNLIPAFPMDGGRILRALLATRLTYLRATLVAAVISKVVASLAIVFFLYLGLTGSSGAYFGAALFAFILFAGDAEYRSVRNQDMAEAHWHAMMAELQRRHPTAVPPPLAGEPPLLHPEKGDWELGPRP
jgi:Zn-dependent protease